MNGAPLDARSLEGWERHLEQPVDPATIRSALAADTIPQVAAATAARVPQRTALRVGGQAITHGELDDRARRLASWLGARGAGPGRPVILAGPNSVDFAVGYLGALHAGAPVIPANPMLTERELAVIIEDTAPVAGLGGGRSLEQLLDLMGGDSLPRVLDLSGEGPGSVAGAVADSSRSPVRAARSSEIAHLAFTSGTTGRPKVTPLTHGNLLASIRTVMWAWRWREGDVLVHALPLQHGHGLSGVQALAVSGCTGVVLPAFDPDELVQAIAVHRGTVLFSVPAIYERLLESAAFQPGPMSGLRLATTGSAPLSPATSDAVTEVLGHRPLERYGCTETGYVLSNPYRGRRRAGMVGFPLPGAEVRVVDRAGRPVPEQTDGEIVARGPQVFGGYLGRDASDEVYFAGGWFRTGDLGHVDEDGYFRITGRSKELIITGGLNVYPREVELALEQDPDVASAAVVGVPSPQWGEEVTAFVVPAADRPLEIGAVQGRLRVQLAGYKCPKTMHVVPELPRNHMGKVLRTALVEDALRRALEVPENVIHNTDMSSDVSSDRSSPRSSHRRS